jgi:CHAT domain-containing protein/tetratricopeptide (TPR) repeat protein
MTPPHRIGPLVCCLGLLCVAAAPPARLSPEKVQELRRARALFDKARGLARAGKRAGALDAMRRSAVAYQQVRGENHPDSAFVLGELAALHQHFGDAAGALEPMRQAVGRYRASVGEKDPRYVEALNNLGVLCREAGRHDEALKASLRAEALCRTSPGEKDPLYASTLDNLAALYQARGERAKALPLCQRALRLRAGLLGEKHADVATSLNNLASLYRDLGQYKRALPLFEKAVAVAAATLGEKHPQYAHTLNNLALLHLQMGQPARALPGLRKALELRKEVLGADHPDVADSLASLGRFYTHQGAYGQALPLFQEAAGLVKRARGETHPEYATCLYRLGGLYFYLGDFGRAAALLERAAALRRQALGKRHPDYAEALNALALAYKETGAYAKALPMYLEAVELQRAAWGEAHPAYAVALGNLAALYRAKGDYRRAAPLYRQTVDILSRGESRAYYATALNNLSVFYRDTGAHADAVAALEQAIALRKKLLGEKHPLYANSLNTLAGLYLQLGQTGRAQALFEKALALRTAALGERHPDTIGSLTSLAYLYDATGRADKALPLAGRAATLAREVLGEAHPLCALATAQWASVCQNTGRLSKAVRLAERARQLYAQAVGEQHPRYAQCLALLASVYRDAGQPDRARPLFAASLTFRQAELESTFSCLPERQRLDLAAVVRRGLGEYLSLAVGAAGADELYARVLAWKGMVAARQSEEAVVRDRPELAGLLAELRAARASLARAVNRIPPPAGRPAWRAGVRRLQQAKERVEAQLAEKAAGFRAARQASAAAVTAALPAGVVLVDFLEYTHHTPPAGRPRVRKAERRLVAFVLRQGEPCVLVELGGATQVRDAVATWRASLGGAAEARRAGEELRRRVWLRVEKYLAKDSVVLLAPDGPLGLLPFAALPGSKPDTYLIEERAIAHVSSGRAVLELRAPRRPAAEGLLALGGLDFGKPGRWGDLPGSRAEARQVASAFRAAHGPAPTRLLEGGKGDRATLMGALAGEKHWRYVHLATHAYYDGPGAPAGGPAGEPLLEPNPLLLSGVVLAGANGNPAEGVMIAEEVCGLDLRGAELVTLSACETASGVVASGEGVLGLQRAFHLAGARRVTAALWGVPDAATQALMARFYRRLWGGKKVSTLEALRQAQIEMLRGGLRDPAVLRGVFNPKTGTGKRPLPAAKDGGGRLAPAYWAGFVLSGDWR